MAIFSSGIKEPRLKAKIGVIEEIQRSLLKRGLAARDELGLAASSQSAITHPQAILRSSSIQHGGGTFSQPAPYRGRVFEAKA
jgi:hypothetical protein